MRTCYMCHRPIEHDDQGAYTHVGETRVHATHRAAPRCPRCKGPIPNAQHPGSYPGALSRADNATEICSSCGVDEAMWQFKHGGHRFLNHPPLPPLDQPVWWVDEKKEGDEMT